MAYAGWYEWDSFKTQHIGCKYSSKNNADDYLISPAIKLEKDKQYTLEFEAYARDEDERMEVLMGNGATAEAMNVKLVEPYNVTHSDLGILQNVAFTVPANGDYNIGFHCISNADKYIAIFLEWR